MSAQDVQHPQASLTQDFYDEHLVHENWGLDKTKQLLELVSSMGTKWDDIAKVLKEEPENCSKRYQQVIDALSHKPSRKSSDAGHSDPEAPSKKRRRRTAAEIERGFKCEAPNCNKAYGSEGALKMHVKLKHPGTPAANNPLSLSQGTVTANHMARPVPPKPPTTSRSLDGLNIPLRPINVVEPLPQQLSPKLTPQLPMAPRHADIPLLVVSIGAWHKRSLFCGDTMARISYEERKFVWEIYNLNALFARMEIPFDSVTGMGYELVQDNIVKFFIDVSTPPLFYEGMIQPHKPTVWVPMNTDKITGGEALGNNVRHAIHVLKLSIKQPLEQLMQIEPRFQHIFKVYTPPPPPKAVPYKQNPYSLQVIPVEPPTVHTTSPFTITPSTPIMRPCAIVIPTGYNDVCPGNVPPLVADTDESPRQLVGTTSSDEEEDETTCNISKQQSTLLDGARRCQCFGGCSTSACLCFKSLEACGDSCGCGGCSNPLNEEATSLDLCNSTSSAPSSPIIFFSEIFSPALST